MDTQSIISQKIKEMAENNRRRDESAREAEKKMEEGFVSEPVVEQVKPKPKKKKTVSVQRKAEEKTEQAMTQPESAEDRLGTSSGNNDTKRTLNQSLEEMEKLLNETTMAKRTRDVAGQDEKQIDLDEKEEVPAEEPRNVRTTVKTNPRHRGPHAVHRRVVNLPAAEVPVETPVETHSQIPAEEPLPTAEYCLYEPLTGALNLLLRDRTIIGKSEQANIIIKNRFVSRIHACVIKSGGNYYIEDLGSTNGTFVNGSELNKGERVKLEAGDTITLAATKIIFDIKD